MVFSTTKSTIHFVFLFSLISQESNQQKWNSPLSPEKMSSIPHYGFSRFPIPSPLVFPFSTWFQINCNQEDQIFWYTGLALTPFLLRRKKFITGTIHSMSYFISLPKGKKNLVLLKWTCYLKDKRSLKDSGLKRIWLQQHTPIDVIFMSVYYWTSWLPFKLLMRFREKKVITLYLRVSYY